MSRDLSARHLVVMGPITGIRAMTDELMLHLGYQPADHPDVAMAFEFEIGDEAWDVGHEILARHGLPVRDSVGLDPPPLPAPPPPAPEPSEYAIWKAQQEGRSRGE